MRVGIGYDVHRYTEGRKLILGGIHIPFEKGLKGHSDADVLLHSITDAILGALALGDIGQHFPDNDPKYANADSAILLKKCYQLILDKGYILGNIDATIVAEKPKLKDHVPVMRKRISEILNCEMEQVSVKATTSEKMGFVGREEGIACYSIVALVRG